MQTIELNGRPIAVMGCDHDAVEDYAYSQGFRSDLLALMDRENRPLWNGQGVLSLSVRNALPEEAAIFDRSFSQAVVENEADPDDQGYWLAFLMDVRDPTEGSDPRDPHRRTDPRCSPAAAAIVGRLVQAVGHRVPLWSCGRSSTRRSALTIDTSIVCRRSSKHDL